MVRDLGAPAAHATCYHQAEALGATANHSLKARRDVQSYVFQEVGVFSVRSLWCSKNVDIVIRRLNVEAKHRT